VLSAELSERAEALPVVITMRNKTENIVEIDFLMNMATLPS